jgi:iron uptake system EfeUOB component EfeO/EfeM
MELLNGQTDCEDITENNYTTENCDLLDKIQVNVLHLETAMMQTKNNKSLGYNKLTTDMIKAPGPIGTK